MDAKQFVEMVARMRIDGDGEDGVTLGDERETLDGLIQSARRIQKSDPPTSDK